MRSSSNRWIPWIFVVLWSTGFIGAKLGMPYAGPFAFLAIRMGMTLACFLVLIHFTKADWPATAQAQQQWVSGALLHGCYLGGVFAAIKLALPAGITALIVGLQPVLTAIIGYVRGDLPLSRSQWSGLLLGFGGILLVVSGSKGIVLQAGVGIWAALFALAGITVGTIYQKRYGQGVHPLTGAFHQYVAAFAITAVAALLFERHEAIVWCGQLWFALLWSVIMLSVAAILLLLHMIREGEVAKVASYLYLVPGLTAVEAWLLFNERLNLFAIGGMVLAALGVALVLQRIRLPVATGQISTRSRLGDD